MAFNWLFVFKFLSSFRACRRNTEGSVGRVPNRPSRVKEFNFVSFDRSCNLSLGTTHSFLGKGRFFRVSLGLFCFWWLWKRFEKGLPQDSELSWTWLLLYAKRFLFRGLPVDDSDFVWVFGCVVFYSGIRNWKEGRGFECFNFTCSPLCTSTPSDWSSLIAMREMVAFYRTFITYDLTSTRYFVALW